MIANLAIDGSLNPISLGQHLGHESTETLFRRLHIVLQFSELMGCHSSLLNRRFTRLFGYCEQTSLDCKLKAINIDQPILRVFIIILEDLIDFLFDLLRWAIVQALKRIWPRILLPRNFISRRSLQYRGLDLGSLF